MEVLYFNKLVRDKVPKKIKKNGGKCKVRILSQEGIKNSLPQKLQEEVSELLNAQSKMEKLAECADIIEVLIKALSMSGWLVRDLSETRKQLRETNGFEADQLLPSLELLVKDFHDDTSSASVKRIAALGIELCIEIAKSSGFSTEDLEDEIERKSNKAGRFDKGYFLVWATKK